jgi:hypothetical protein
MLLPLQCELMNISFDRENDKVRNMQKFHANHQGNIGVKVITNLLL